MAFRKPTTRAISLGARLRVEWDAIQDAERYALDYSWDDGKSFTELALGSPTDTYYEWQELKAVCSNCGTIRVRGYAGTDLKGTVELPVAFLPFQMGVVSADANSADWHLNDNKYKGSAKDEKYPGTRVFCTTVTFSPAFARAPDVFAGMAHFDIAKDFNGRFVCEVQDVSASSFVMRFRTFADTLVYGGTATWIAVPKPAP